MGIGGQVGGVGPGSDHFHGAALPQLGRVRLRGMKPFQRAQMLGSDVVYKLGVGACVGKTHLGGHSFWNFWRRHEELKLIKRGKKVHPEMP